MTQQKKYLTTGILVLAILIVMFLAAGITNLDFKPSGIVDREERGEFQLSPLKLPSLSPIWGQVLLVLFSVILPIAVVLFIKYPEFRRLTYRRLIYLLLYGLLLFAVVGKTQEESPPTSEVAKEEGVSNAFIDAQRDALTFVNAVSEPSPELNRILNIAIVLLVVLLLWFVYRQFFRPETPIADQIKAEAEEAIIEIQAGESLRNVIIRCYADMSQILREERGLQRDKAMTPREFERELQEVGLPFTAVQRLTRLFEEVRYGNIDLNQAAEQEALQCLTTIAEAC